MTTPDEDLHSQLGKMGAEFGGCLGSTLFPPFLARGVFEAAVGPTVATAVVAPGIAHAAASGVGAGARAGALGGRAAGLGAACLVVGVRIETHALAI